jgi:membrane-bound lytic murein transglycosylase B
MGQSQFMPTSFLSYAVDADGDGRRDIWTSVPDVFASIANYLARAGWRPAEPWGQRVRLPAGLDGALAGAGVEKPLAAWQRLGIRRADGRELPRGALPASLVFPRGASKLAVLVHQNARVLMR